LEERAEVVRRVAEVFIERADDLARIAALEMGKRFSEGLGELGLVSDIFTYYADNGPAFMGDEELPIAGGTAGLLTRPIGPVLGIMPGNYPYYQVARFAAPNLMLGNPVLLKHAPSCPQAAAAIEQVMRDAGVPEGAYLNLYASNDQVSQMLADPRVKAVSLTGSDRAGAAVAEAAGRNL
jgi:succinate-semialdehyde dehydrogenase/glutarate-semialdehyde dehydrogenase